MRKGVHSLTTTQLNQKNNSRANDTSRSPFRPAMRSLSRHPEWWDTHALVTCAWLLVTTVATLPMAYTTFEELHRCSVCSCSIATSRKKKRPDHGGPKSTVLPGVRRDPRGKGENIPRWHHPRQLHARLWPAGLWSRAARSFSHKQASWQAADDAWSWRLTGVQLKYAYCLACEYTKTSFLQHAAVEFATYTIDSAADSPGAVTAAGWLIHEMHVVAIIGALTSSDCELLSLTYGADLVCAQQRSKQIKHRLRLR